MSMDIRKALHRKDHLQQNTERRPHLPTHDQTTTNGCRGVLGSVWGDSSSLGTHTDTEEETADEELLPVLREGGTDDGDKTEDGGEEDTTTTAEPVV